MVARGPPRSFTVTPVVPRRNPTVQSPSGDPAESRVLPSSSGCHDGVLDMGSLPATDRYTDRPYPTDHCSPRVHTPRNPFLGRPCGFWGPVPCVRPPPPMSLYLGFLLQTTVGLGLSIGRPTVHPRHESSGRRQDTCTHPRTLRYATRTERGRRGAGSNTTTRHVPRAKESFKYGTRRSIRLLLTQTHGDPARPEGSRGPENGNDRNDTKSGNAGQCLLC